MRKYNIFIVIALLSVSSFPSYGQTVTEIADKAKVAAGIADTSRKEKWVFGGRFQLSLNQSYSSNWVGSSDPFIGLSTLDHLYLFYNKGKLSWENTLDFDFGTRYTFKTKTSEKGKYEKTSDKIELNSKLGFKLGGDWYYGALFNLYTQLFKSTDPGNDSIVTSTFMTPGTATLSLGMEYKRKMWSWYVSPLAGKMMTKTHPDFYRQVAFGIDSLDRVNFSVGALTRIAFSADIHPKIHLNGKLELFYDYLGDYQNLRNMTTNFEMTWRFSVTDWLFATLRVAMYYDYNIRFNVYDGNGDVIDGITTDHLQFQETFGLTLGYKFRTPKQAK